MATNKQKLMAAFLTVSAAGLAMIHQFESGNRVITKSYADTGDVQTICDGHTKGVVKGMTVTKDQCLIFLKEDTNESGKVIVKYVHIPLTQGQYDALIDFIHNFGETKFAKSTLLKKINQNKCKEAGDEFLRWNKSVVDGRLVVVAGLDKRRKAERQLWLEGCD